MSMSKRVSKTAFAILTALIVMLVPTVPNITQAAEDNEIVFTIDNISVSKDGKGIAALQNGSLEVTADITNISSDQYTPLLLAFACIGENGAEDIDRFIINDTAYYDTISFAAGESKKSNL